MALSKEEMRLYQRARRAKLKVVKDTGAGCSICGQKPAVNLEGTYWLCGGCVNEKLKDIVEIQKPKIQDWRKDKVVGCRKFGE
jgi:hypothetical protein